MPQNIIDIYYKISNIWIAWFYHSIKSMLDKVPIFINQKKRYKHFHTLNMEEVNVLRSSSDPEFLAGEFDKIFLKLQRLISYSTNKNLNEKSKLEEETNNLLRKFLNYMKWKIIDRKSNDEQRTIFNDICWFINFFDWDSYFSRVHNSLAKTTLKEYNNKSIWEQFFQTSYWRGWENWIAEGWSCSYWTVLLYNFFNKLKESGLNMEIKLFRYKNLDDKIIDFPSMRHSWLVITFQWEDYFVDYEWIEINEREPIVKKIQPYINLAKNKLKNDKIANFFENFKYGNMKETDKVIFFDNVNDLISHVEEFPEYKRIAFYIKYEDWKKPYKLTYEFIENWIWIGINKSRHIFYLWDNNISREWFPENIIDKITLEKDSLWCHPITNKDKELFKKFFNVIANKIDINWLYDNFTSLGKRESKIIDYWWSQSIFMVKEMKDSK